ncbi:hypothetical protein ID866_5819 [Astraeus odoratus]|nr:hypothetical protein ID866_5819 [Astraeus odoratus]
MLAMANDAPRRPLRITIDTSWSENRSQLLPEDSPLASPKRAASGSTPNSAHDWAICQVLCMFDFQSPDPDQLSFNKNEILTVIKQEESGWWAAMRPEGDRIGWIPSSFVEPLPGCKVDEPQEAHLMSEHEQRPLRVFEEFYEVDIYSILEDHEWWARGLDGI